MIVILIGKVDKTDKSLDVVVISLKIRTVKAVNMNYVSALEPCNECYPNIYFRYPSGFSF